MHQLLSVELSALMRKTNKQTEKKHTWLQRISIKKLISTFTGIQWHWLMKSNLQEVEGEKKHLFSF